MNAILKRLFQRCITALSLLALVAFLCPISFAADRPNVVFIAVDDLNDWVGFLGGYPGLKTPNFNRLAARGTLFTHAYCSAPACNPSRASLLCGIRPSTSGVYHNSQPWRPAMPQAVTLPQHFTAAGYDVAGCGKLFHGRFKERESWQEYYGRPDDPRPDGRPLNGIANAQHFDWGPVDVDDARMGDAQVVDWAVEQMNREREKPLFLAVGLFRPHLPWYVPPQYFKQFPLEDVVLPNVPDDDLDDVPPLGRAIAKPEGDHRRVVESDNWQRAVQGYLASITFADGQIGRLLDAIDKSPLKENTIIVMWGDHGWHLGEKHHWRKFALWEEATRVPMVVSVPGMTEAGSKCERTVSLLDLYPTLVELCGLPSRDVLEGDSIVTLLQDPNAKWDRPIVTTHGRNNHAVRDERWRYIRYEDGTEELYDHESDPMEWTNLAASAEYDDVKERLAASLPKINAPDAKSQPKGQNRRRNRAANRRE